MSPETPAARLAAPLAALLPLSDPARALLTPTLAVRAYFQALLAAKLDEDALRFLALALPKREAVWWGVRCAIQSPPPADPVEKKALDAARQWAATPTDALRDSAHGCADAAGWGTPGGALAGACWLSGGSLSPLGLPVVTPRDDLTGQTVAGALLLLLAQDPKRLADRLAEFLSLGQAVANGESRPGA